MESFMKESNMMDALDNLYDIAMEAIAQRRDAEEDKVQKIVLPRLALQSKILPPKDPVIPDSMPAIPRKAKVTNVTELIEHDLKPTWFFVQSPRETYGVVGPFNVPDLQTMFKYGDIDDDTYLWQEDQKNHLGEEMWMPLKEITHLRYKIVHVPEIPEKIVLSSDQAAGNPFTGKLTSEMKDGREDIDRFEPSAACTFCGGPASHYVPRDLIAEAGADPDRVPEINVLRHASGSTKACSETVPGFLWVGTSHAAKASVFYQMQFSLIICCCTELRNPSAKPPNYRCRRAQLDDNPPVPDDGSDKSRTFIESTICTFDEVHDWIEYERLRPERGEESDLPLPKYRGPTDKYGRPLHPHDDGFPKKTLAERSALGYKVRPASKVLVWSKTGNDRGPTIVCAYLIRRWGMSLQAALQVLGKAREVLNICPAYLYILREYQTRHWVGQLICEDCSLSQKYAGVDKEVYDNLSGNWEKWREEEKEEEEEAEDTKKGKEHASRGMTGEELRAAVAKKSFKCSMEMLTRRLTAESISDTGEYINQAIKQVADPSHTSCDLDLAISLKASSHLTRLGPPNLYVKQVGLPLPANASPYLLKYNNLVDLCLSGRNLGDEGTVDLFIALSLTSVISRIRQLEMQCNQIGDAGAIAIAESLTFADPPSKDVDSHHSNHLEIVNMNLSDNSIKKAGCVALGEMLRYCNSLVTLNMSNNRSGDDGISQIITSIGTPALGFADEGDEDDEEDLTAKFLTPHNNSLTDLRLMNNSMGPLAIAAIEKLLITNKTITGLHLDFNTTLSNKDLKTLIRGIKKYNLSIQSLSISDMPLTMKNFDGIMRLFEKPVAPVKLHVPIRQLNVARCGINSSYLPLWPNIMRTGALYLTALDISGNPLEDAGVKILGEALIASAVFDKRNRIDANDGGFDSQSHVSDDTSLSSIDLGNAKLSLSAAQSSFASASKFRIEFIPLRSLNVSTCKFGTNGLLALLDSVVRLSTLEMLDLSHNNVGPRPSYMTAARDEENEAPSDDESLDSSEARADKMQIMADYIKRMQLRELKMTNCRLYTKGSAALMKALCETEPDTCGATLKTLLLSGNEIYNSVAASVLELLESNFQLEVLDLGFNKLTKEFDKDVKGIITTTSVSDNAAKLKNLTVTLMGNECDPFLFDAPGMARSKNTTHFRSARHSSTETFEYVPKNARKSFMERVKFDNMAFGQNSPAKANFIA